MKRWSEYPFGNFMIRPTKLGIGPIKSYRGKQEKEGKSWAKDRGCIRMGPVTI
jgi:hypothetical protein